MLENACLHLRSKPRRSIQAYPPDRRLPLLGCLGFEASKNSGQWSDLGKYMQEERREEANADAEEGLIY